MTTTGQRRSTSFPRWVLVVLAVLGTLVLLLAAGLWAASGHYARERRGWAKSAIERLNPLSITNPSVSNELEQLKCSILSADSPEWVAESVLLATNGEYLIFDHWHGANSGFVDHLFLGHGSDGRWFYSTYHFCNGMVGVFADDPPGSIEEFASRYSVREFDGRPENCLGHTWP